MIKYSASINFTNPELTFVMRKKARDATQVWDWDCWRYLAGPAIATFGGEFDNLEDLIEFAYHVISTSKLSESNKNAYFDYINSMI